jgi:hypothetical protein
VQAVCSVVALLGFAWVVRRSQAWEATAAAFTLIPIWVAPAGYYFQFVVVAILLATRRPWIAVWTLTVAFGWIVNGLVWRPRQEQYTVVSLLVLALSLAVWISMLRPASDAETESTGSVA